MNDSTRRFSNVLLPDRSRGLVVTPTAGRQQQLQFQQLQLAPQQQQQRSMEELITTENASTIRGQQHPQQILQQLSAQSSFRQVQSHRGSTHQLGYNPRSSLERHSSVERLQLNTVIPSSSPSPRENHQYQFPSSQLLRQLTAGNRLNGSITLNAAGNVYQSQNNSQNSSINGIFNNNNNNNVSGSNAQQLLLAEDHSSKIASLGATFQAAECSSSNNNNSMGAVTAGSGFFRTRTINTWDDSSNVTQFNRRNSAGISIQQQQQQQYHIVSPLHASQQQQQYQLQEQQQYQIIQQQQRLFDSQVIQPTASAAAAAAVPAYLHERKGSLVVQQPTELAHNNGSIIDSKQQLSSNNNNSSNLQNQQNKQDNSRINNNNNTYGKAVISCAPTSASYSSSSSSVTSMHGNSLLRSQQSLHHHHQQQTISADMIKNNNNLELKKAVSPKQCIESISEAYGNGQSKQCSSSLAAFETDSTISNSSKNNRPSNNNNNNNKNQDWSERKPRKEETTNERHHGAWSSGKVLDRQQELSLDTKKQTQQSLSGKTSVASTTIATATTNTRTATPACSSSSAALLSQQSNTNIILGQSARAVGGDVSSNGEVNNKSKSNRNSSNSNTNNNNKKNPNIPICTLSARGPSSSSSAGSQPKMNLMISGGAAQNNLLSSSTSSTTTSSTPSTSSFSSAAQLSQRIIYLERALFETKQAQASSLKYQADLERKMKMLIKQNEYLTGQEHPASPRRQAALQLQQGQILIDFEKRIEELVTENERINKAMLHMMMTQQQQKAAEQQGVVAEKNNKKKMAQLSNKIQILQEREEKHKTRISQLEDDKTQLLKKLKEFTTTTMTTAVKDTEVESKDVQKNCCNCDGQKIKELVLLASGNEEIPEKKKKVSEEGEIAGNKLIEGFERRIGKLVAENERLNKLLALNCTQDLELRKIKQDQQAVLQERDYWRAKCMEMDKNQAKEEEQNRTMQQSETCSIAANNSTTTLVVSANIENNNNNNNNTNNRNRTTAEQDERTSDIHSSTSQDKTAKAEKKTTTGSSSSIHFSTNLESRLTHVLTENQKLNNILTEQINITQPRS